jgi:predicted RND superfamily exporter protein
MEITGMKIGKIFSINDILKETNQALHANDPSYYTIPQDHDVIAQEFFLFENTGSDDLEKVVDSQFSKTRITIKLLWVEIFTADKIIKAVTREFDEAFAGKADITMTGMSGLMARTVPAALVSMRHSYIIAAVVITIMMILLMGNVKIGLISMVPNLLPIFMVMAFMAYINIPLDFNGLMIGSIALGLVVDDTMHFMYNFRKYYHITGDPKEAIRKTFLGTGRALLITSLVLSSGFFVTMFATLSNTIIFGLFTGLVILIALLADFVLAPALMFLLYKKGRGSLLEQSRVIGKTEQQGLEN